MGRMAELAYDQQQNESGLDLCEAEYYEQERIRQLAGTAADDILHNNLNRSNNMNPNELNSLSFTELVPTKSTYLKKDDVGEDGVILTIKGFTQETIEGDHGDEIKVVMHFVEEGYKPMVLNSTNAAVLGKITGAATAGEARGKQIVVYDDPSVSFGGKVTGGLRIKRVQGAPAPAAPRAARPAPVASDPFDDVPY